MGSVKTIRLLSVKVYTPYNHGVVKLEVIQVLKPPVAIQVPSSGYKTLSSKLKNELFSYSDNHQHIHV